MQNKDMLWQRLADEATKKGGGGADIVDAYKYLYSVHSDRLLTWLGGLFDSEIGGFYYSNSARDNEYQEIDGVKHYFFPDIESTNQATNLLQNAGVIKEFSELPEWMRKKMAEFNKSLSLDITTLFYNVSGEYSKISSSVVRDRIKNNLDLNGYLPEKIIPIIKKNNQ